MNSTDGKDINSYADDYFDENGYGIGSQYDGALFILDYIGREMAISTSGYGITVFTDYGIDYVLMNWLMICQLDIIIKPLINILHFQKN